MYNLEYIFMTKKNKAWLSICNSTIQSPTTHPGVHQVVLAIVISASEIMLLLCVIFSNVYEWVFRSRQVRTGIDAHNSTYKFIDNQKLMGFKFSFLTAFLNISDLSFVITQ
jgi:hypothetical protein